MFDKKTLNEGDSLYLASLMSKIADNKYLYDKPISKFDMNYKITPSEYLKYDNKD